MNWHIRILNKKPEKRMRVLALGDIHNAFVITEKILLSEKEYDVILICGDITTNGSASEVKRVIGELKKFGKPILAVAGNMDSPEIDKILVKAGCSINAKSIVIGDVGFFGVSASPISRLHTPYEISEDEILKRAEAGYKKMKKVRWKIFVPHSPPHDTRLDVIIGGSHVGSVSVRKFIERHQPDAVVCGHIHEACGKDAMGKSQMINCGPAAEGCYAIIELSDKVYMENRK